jgi:signal transduction histidine kinase
MQRLDSILQNIYFYSLNLRKPIEKESVNLRDVFEETYKQLNHPNKKDAIFKINQRIENNVYTDAARLKIFARHVVQNSLQFAIPPTIGEKMKIEIHIEHEGEFVNLRLSDNGPGLPEEFNLLVRNMFNRGSLLSEGAGLGFFLCKEIAIKLNGTLQIESQPGKGTHHILRIPAN